MNYLVFIRSPSADSWFLNNERKWSTKNNLIMQNEPNFRKLKIDVTSVKVKYYENNRLSERRQNEPNFDENEAKCYLRDYSFEANRGFSEVS